MMPELTKEQLKKIEDAIDSVYQIKTVLLGATGQTDGGICGVVKGLMETSIRQQKEIEAQKRDFYTLVALLVGTGVLGGGTFALIKLVA
jgi:hypothetical protein